MGYSCTTDADVTMHNIMAVSGSNSSNTWEGNNGFVYFAEIGRENSDGAITGMVYKIMRDGRAAPSGGFRIDPNGYVKRWPCLNKAMRAKANEINTELDRIY